MEEAMRAGGNNKEHGGEKEKQREVAPQFHQKDLPSKPHKNAC